MQRKSMAQYWGDQWLKDLSMCRYMWRHGYNTSFYQLAEQIASPATKATVLSTIINRNDSTFPTDADYFAIIRTCKPIPTNPLCLCVYHDGHQDVEGMHC